MITFLPYKSFERSAQCLDYKRLGKQRVEAKQILQINLAKLENPNIKIKWENHPAVLMWRGYEHCLSSYGYSMCEEWIKRGYKDNLISFFHFYMCGGMKNISLQTPSWLENVYLHLSHQSNLIRKDPEFYRPKFGYWIPDNLHYVWPVKKEK